jgi:hypothetical protein
MGNLIRKKKRQNGAVLLIFALVLIVGSTYSLIIKLNSDTSFFAREGRQTQESLRLAKQALIAYAINFPEIDAASGNDLVNGPGYLPCPDLNNDGSAATNCSVGGNTTIGRLPYETLEVSDLRDSSGARLWYVLSDNYANKTPRLEPLNSETDGQLTIDGNTDIVAVIIAPGVPIGNQSRDPADTNILTEIANYLENDNNNLDQSFISQDPDPTNFTDFNDNLITITRQELMELVEKRVLGDLRTALASYKTTHGAYPWLSPFVDPKSVARQLRDLAGSGSAGLTLQDGSSNIDFNDWGVSAGDTVYNLTDGSVGIVTGAVNSNSLTVSSLVFGTDNDFDEFDEYVIVPQALPTTLSGTASAGGDNNTLVDNNRTLDDMGITVGQVVDNLTDNSSSVITAVTANSIEVDGLSGGTDNLFQTGDSYQIRSNYGVATNAAASETQLQDTNKNFLTMGVSAGDIVQNITDESVGRITSVTATTITVDELLFGTNNEFSANNVYVIPKYNSTENIREGLLAIHEVGEAFQTDLTFDWTITPVAADKTISNSTIIENYLDNYLAANSETFTESVGACIWVMANVADCYAYNKDFINISGNDDSATTNKVWIGDSSATFLTDGIKRGDIAQNYDDESQVFEGVADFVSGTATANSSNLILEDTANNFINTPIAVGDTVTNITDGSTGTIASFSATQITVTSLNGGANNVFTDGDSYQISYDSIRLFDASEDFSIYERYSYLVQNQTLEAELGVSKIQAILADVIQDDTLEALNYNGEGGADIRFRPGDTYRIYRPRQFVVETVWSETQVTTDNYLDGVNPDFDNGEYYRIMPAANSINDRVFDVTGTWPDQFTAPAGTTFVTDGVEIGDIVENHDGAFGEVTAVTETTITAYLRGGAASNNFVAGEDFTVYYDYVYSREHTIHAKFSGNQATTTVSQERKRDVCLGYNADCSAVAAAVTFADNNGGVPLVTVTDYQEDETTEVGTAIFTPSNLSSGTLRISNIDFYLNDVAGDLPVWFFRNDWHKLVYVAYSQGDVPNAGAACDAGASCLILNGAKAPSPNDDKRAVLIAAGMEINKSVDDDCVTPLVAVQDRSNGTINEYFELENCDEGDDSFQEQFTTTTFNDQVRVVEPDP